MINVNDGTLRNLQQQVLKNKQDIEAFKSAETVLADFGIHVLGQVDDIADIPEKEYEYGDAYLVGVEPPYDIYIFTRGELPEFINLGPLALEGPKGETGDIGPEGPAGLRGSKIFTGTGSPTSQTIEAIEGDIYIRTDDESPRNLTKGYVYQYQNDDWKFKTSVRGAQGIQGPAGSIGPRGFTGDVGPMGPAGMPGQSFLIQGVLNDPSLLPNPEETQRNYAYVVKTASYNRLYFITGEDTLIWDYVDMGNVGSTVTENGQAVDTYNADTAKLRTVQFYNPASVLKDAELGGYAIIGDGYIETADDNVSYNLEASAIVLPLDDTNEITWSVDQSGTKLQAHLAGDVTNKLAKALVTPTSAPTITKLVGIDTANSQTLFNLTTELTPQNGASNANVLTNKGIYDYINKQSYSNRNNANNYFYVGNMLIQFGTVGSYSGGSGLATYTVTFPRTFNNTNYFVLAVPDGYTTDSPQSYDYTGMVKISNTSKNSCTFSVNYVGGNKRGVQYIAIGQGSTNRDA